MTRYERIRSVLFHLNVATVDIDSIPAHEHIDDSIAEAREYCKNAIEEMEQARFFILENEDPLPELRSELEEATKGADTTLHNWGASYKGEGYGFWHMRQDSLKDTIEEIEKERQMVADAVKVPKWFSLSRMRNKPNSDA